MLLTKINLKILFFNYYFKSGLLKQSKQYLFFLCFAYCKHAFHYNWGFATKYRIDVHVNDTDNLHDVLASGDMKQDSESLKCLIVTLISFAISYRRRDDQKPFEDTGDKLQDLAMPLSLLAATASGKEWWWTEQMIKFCIINRELPQIKCI